MIGSYPAGGSGGIGGVQIAARSLDDVCAQLTAETYPGWTGASADAARDRKDGAAGLAILAAQSIANAQAAIHRYYEAFGQEALRAANPIEHAKTGWNFVESSVEDMLGQPLPLGHPAITPGMGGYPLGPPLLSGPSAPGSPGWGTMPAPSGGGGQP